MPYADTSSPRARYVMHKSNASGRAIVFKLTFNQWWLLWERHWRDRGRGAGKKVMCRVGDTGAYEVGNVYIGTQEHNGSVKVGVRPYTMAKLSEQDIPRVRDMITTGASKQAIGSWFGVSRNAIRQIDEGKAWRTC